MFTKKRPCKRIKKMKKISPTPESIRQVITNHFGNICEVLDPKKKQKAINQLVEKVELRKDEIVCYMVDQKKRTCVKHTL